jgi:hypothetical protein
MVGEFNRNIFIMLLSIMVGVIVITFFIADLQARSQVTEELTYKHTEEIKDLESKNINFTTRFINSLGLFDKAREDRAHGDYNFEVAFLWYTSALNENDNATFNTYKNRTIDHCEDAIANYLNSSGNFLTAREKFQKTKEYTHYDVYKKLLDLYVNLTASGHRLTTLRINASTYLTYLSENLTFSDNAVVFEQNITDLYNLFNITMIAYTTELMDVYKEIEKDIESEYDIFGFIEDREL